MPLLADSVTSLYCLPTTSLQHTQQGSSLSDGARTSKLIAKVVRSLSSPQPLVRFAPANLRSTESSWNRSRGYLHPPFHCTAVSQLSFKLPLKRRHHHGIPPSWQVSLMFFTSSDFNHLRGDCELHLNHFGGGTDELRRWVIVN